MVNHATKDDESFHLIAGKATVESKPAAFAYILEAGRCEITSLAHWTDFSDTGIVAATLAGTGEATAVMLTYKNGSPATEIIIFAPFADLTNAAATIIKVNILG